MIRLLFIALLATAIIWVAFKAIVDFRSLFRIDVRRGRAGLKGDIPGRAWPEVRDFIESLHLPSRCSIIGMRDGTRFRLMFNGPLDEGTRQRIRNFLYL